LEIPIMREAPKEVFRKQDTHYWGDLQCLSGAVQFDLMRGGIAETASESIILVHQV
jgi:hypothetical protein